MQKRFHNVRSELKNYRYQHNLMQIVPCTEEENQEFEKMLQNGDKLPSGVYVFEDCLEFYRMYESDLTPTEIQEFLAHRQLKYLRTIKNCVVFFTTLTIIGMVASLLYFLGILGIFF